MKATDSPKPFLEHLEEFRKRFLRCVVIFLGFSGGATFVVDQVISQLSKTIGLPFIFVHPTEAFFIKLKIALIVGLFLSVPFLIYEAWRFVGVALTIKERRWILGVLPVSYLLFCAGVALSWFVVLPAAAKFLVGFSSESLRPFLSIDAFVSFAAWMTLAFGSLFQLPIFVLFLVKMGIVDVHTISRYRPHVVAGLALLSAFLTPGPDPFTQLALLIPSYTLFELSLVIGRMLDRPQALPKAGEQWNPE